MIVLLLAVAGGLGAVTRFVVDGLVRSRIRTALPFGTILINLTGSLLLGFLAGLVTAGRMAGEWQTILGTGFLGGYTTFSTASFETVRLVQSDRIGLAALNGLGTLLGSVAAAAAGLALGIML